LLGWLSLELVPAESTLLLLPLSLLGLEGYLCADAVHAWLLYCTDEGCVVGRMQLVLLKLRRRNRGEVSLNIASSDALLFTFVIQCLVLLGLTVGERHDSLLSLLGGEHTAAVDGW